MRLVLEIDGKEYDILRIDDMPYTKVITEKSESGRMRTLICNSDNKYFLEMTKSYYIHNKYPEVFIKTYDNKAEVIRKITLTDVEINSTSGSNSSLELECRSWVDEYIDDIAGKGSIPLPPKSQSINEN